MDFTVIVGNPPYQRRDNGANSSATPIYHHFVNASTHMNPQYVTMIIPSRWMARGKGLDTFRNTMLNDKHITRIVDYLNARECFPEVEIKGGVCYFLWEREPSTIGCLMETVTAGVKRSPTDTNGNPILRDLAQRDILVRDPIAAAVLDKVLTFNEPMMSEQTSTHKPFGLRGNYTGYEDTVFDGAVKLYRRGGHGYVTRGQLQRNHQWVDCWKVLTAKGADGKATYPINVLGKPIVAEPGSACTETYLVMGVYDTEEEAQKLDTYMRTKFFRFMVSLRKITQDVARSVFTWTPQQDMSIQWTDDMLYAKYGLTREETELIEHCIKPF